MADATSATGLGSVTAKPAASFLEEYERQLALKKQQGAMAPDAFQQNYKSASERLAEIAAGTPSTAVQAAQQASREALARQAGNVRAATAQNIAASGQLGQGAGARAAQATETGIMKSMADSRLAERQAIGQEAMDANRDIISGAQSERAFQANQQSQQSANLQNLLQFGTAAQKLEAQVGLQQLAGITPSSKADEINERAYQEAITDPKYLADIATAKQTQMTAETALKEAQWKQQVGERKLTSSGSSYRAVDYDINASPGEVVDVDGKPMTFIRRETIDKKSGGIQRGFKDFVLHRYVFQDANGNVVTKDEQWGSGLS